MTNDDLLQLADEEAKTILDSLATTSNTSLEILLRDAVLRGMLIGSRIQVANAESFLALMKAEKR